MPRSVRFRPLTAAFLVVLVALPSPAWAQDAAASTTYPGAVTTGTGRIAGKVEASDRKTAIPGAVVRALHLESGQTFGSTPADSRGRFSLVDLPHGYYDLWIETSDGAFPSSEAVILPPAGKVSVDFFIEAYEDGRDAARAGGDRRLVPGTQQPGVGAAEVRERVGGRDFWKSPAGIAILGGGIAAVILALAASSSEPRDLFPAPEPTP
jgi:hypothetical protein